MGVDGRFWEPKAEGGGMEAVEWVTPDAEQASLGSYLVPLSENSVCEESHLIFFVLSDEERGHVGWKHILQQ